MRRTLAIIAAISLAVATISAADARGVHHKGGTAGAGARRHTAKRATVATTTKPCQPTAGAICGSLASPTRDFGASGPYVGLKYRGDP